MPCPVIMAVHGYALGLGAGLAVAGDFDPQVARDTDHAERSLRFVEYGNEQRVREPSAAAERAAIEANEQVIVGVLEGRRADRGGDQRPRSDARIRLGRRRDR